MEAGDFDGKGIDLIDAMVMSADSRCSDADIEKIGVGPAPDAVHVRACLQPTP